MCQHPAASTRNASNRWGKQVDLRDNNEEQRCADGNRVPEVAVCDVDTQEAAGCRHEWPSGQ